MDFVQNAPKKYWIKITNKAERINKMMKMVKLLVIYMLLISVVQFACAQDDDDSGVVIYPDGSLGFDIGGGYQAMPGRRGEGYETLPAQDYREPYRDTQYGAQLGDGFVGTFPEFSFKRGGEVSAEVKEEEEITDYIFHAYTTSPDVSPLWGYSEPSDIEESQQKGE
jgi:hypothetical protein